MRPNLRNAKPPCPPIGLAGEAGVLPEESTYSDSCATTVPMRFKGSSARKSSTHPHIIMKCQTILLHASALLLAGFLTACDQNTYIGNPAPSPQLPGDVDLGHGYVRRDGAIHFLGGGTTGTGANATRIDTPAPELFRMVARSHFGPFTTAEGLDVDSFEALSVEYTRDKDRVYFKVISPGVFLVIGLPEADPATFEPLAFNLARDKNHVWLNDRIQPEADPSTLVLVDGGRVFKDKDSVHYADQTINGADPATFTHIGSGYYRDKNHIYWGTDPIPDTDLSTFEVLGNSFVAKDKNRVYRSGQPMADLDAATIKLILHDPAGHQILSDKNGIYLGSLPFPRAQPVDAEVIDNLTVKAGDLILLVHSNYSTPVTLFKADGKVMAETFSYDSTSREPTGIITAELTADGLKNIRIAPLPGNTKLPSESNPWIEILKQTYFIRKMREAARHIK